MFDSLPAASQTVADVRLPYSLMACHELSMNAWITVFCKVFAEQASILVACQQCSCVQVAGVRLPYSLMACHELSMNAGVTVLCKVYAEQASILVACQQQGNCVQVAGVRLPYTVRDCDELNMKAWVTKLDTISDVCLTAALLLCASCH